MASSQQGFGTAPQASYGAFGRTAAFSDNNSWNSSEGTSFESLSKTTSDKIFKITTNASLLERSAKKLNTKDERPELHTQLHNLQHQTKELTTEVTDLIRQLHHQSQRHGDKQQKLQVDRLKSSFKAAIERYSVVQKKVTDQMKSTELLSHAPRSAEDHDTWSDEAALLEQERRREQIQQQQLLIEDEVALARDREEKIRQIESDVIDVNVIFKDLAALVDEQGVVVDDIEANVTRAADYVDDGNVQLEKAASYQRSYRKKLCCLAIIFFVVAAVVAIILGVTLGNKHK